MSSARRGSPDTSQTSAPRTTRSPVLPAAPGPTDSAATSEALKFFAWAYKNGGQMAQSLDYIPMPANVVDMIHAKWKSEIKDSSGKSLMN